MIYPESIQHEKSFRYVRQIRRPVVSDTIPFPWTSNLYYSLHVTAVTLTINQDGTLKHNKKQGDGALRCGGIA